MLLGVLLLLLLVTSRHLLSGVASSIRGGPILTLTHQVLHHNHHLLHLLHQDHLLLLTSLRVVLTLHHLSHHLLHHNYLLLLGVDLWLDVVLLVSIIVLRQRSNIDVLLE